MSKAKEKELKKVLTKLEDAEHKAEVAESVWCETFNDEQPVWLAARNEVYKADRVVTDLQRHRDELLEALDV